MNILVVGRGGREHSIVMKLAESDKADKIYAAPGNGGIAEIAECADINEMDMDGLIAFARKKSVDLTIVGPENPLLSGIVNRFREAGLLVFAPTREAALLEGSKQFAKEFMQKYQIPTAAYKSFTNAADAKGYIEEQDAPIVVKADGLAAGKGVIVAETKEEAFQAVDDMLVNKAFSEAGATIVIEECLVGKEFSLMAFVHENDVYPMVTARDHKRAFDRDQGPNTGGMGAFAPATDISVETLEFSMQNILRKTADGMMKEGRPFTGILYAGLMMTEAGPKVIEFNVRFGDPETQVVLPLLENDLVQVFVDVLAGKDPDLNWADDSCLGIVLASKGYPAAYEKGVRLPAIQKSGNGYIIHSGTKQTEHGLVSDGGRVLLAGARGASLKQAAKDAYQCLKPFSNLDAFYYREDIGKE
ncbi:phosphoribosylamine--glycine ligase [Virgibacillus ihumii]|uniref:phosphoribosylamine--glycine ligase n=1 Tax=Virgibacillus ihumii TaxID=2686091 RepID=UPI00157C88D9|nr:phosphoribosylamine--glycine ligase [Virgibacillus ihumii]